MDARTKKLMEILGISEEEAKQVIADDKAIDQGARMDFDLSPAEEKQARKYAKVGKGEQKSKKTARKPDETKEMVISFLLDALKENDQFNAENLVIVNKNNELSFDLDGTNYSVKLVKHTKKK